MFLQSMFASSDPLSLKLVFNFDNRLLAVYVSVFMQTRSIKSAILNKYPAKMTKDRDGTNTIFSLCVSN